MVTSSLSKSVIRELLARRPLGVFDMSLRDEVVVGLITCERISKGAKVFIRESAQGSCSQHHGRRSEDQENEHADEREDGKQRVEGRGESVKTTTRMSMGWNEVRDTPILSQCQCDIKICAVKQRECDV